MDCVGLLPLSDSYAMQSENKARACWGLWVEATETPQALLAVSVLRLTVPAAPGRLTSLGKCVLLSCQ